MTTSNKMHLKLADDGTLGALVDRLKVLTGERHFAARAVRRVMDLHEPMVNDLQAKQAVIRAKNQEIEALQDELRAEREATAKVKAAVQLLTNWAGSE